jgi:hypothetical protein
MSKLVEGEMYEWSSDTPWLQRMQEILAKHNEWTPEYTKEYLQESIDYFSEETGPVFLCERLYEKAPHPDLGVVPQPYCAFVNVETGVHGEFSVGALEAWFKRVEK